MLARGNDWNPLFQAAFRRLASPGTTAASAGICTARFCTYALKRGTRQYRETSLEQESSSTVALRSEPSCMNHEINCALHSDFPRAVSLSPAPLSPALPWGTAVVVGSGLSVGGATLLSTFY